MPKAYMITYDLNSPGQRYDEIINIIKNEVSISWCSYWKSSYLIKSNYSPDEIQGKLKPFLDSGDRLIVIEVQKNYQGWLEKENWDFIRNNIF